MPIYMSADRGDGTRDCFLAGRLTRDSKFEYTKVKGTPKASFSVAYGEKKYMNVVSVGDNAITDVAARLEGGDIVFVAGTYTARKYTGRDGSEKEWREVLASFIAPQPTFAAESDAPAQDSEAQAAPPPLEELDDDGELPF